MSPTPFSLVRNKLKVAKEALNQTDSIEKCIYCQPLKQSIEMHHPNVTSIMNALPILLKCDYCKTKIGLIVQCAKRGHLIP